MVGIPLERLDSVETLVREACELFTMSPLAPIIERMTLPDSAGTEQPVIRIEVARSLFVHQSRGGYMHRVGSSKRPITPEQLGRLFQQQSQSRLIRFDETPVAKVEMTDLDETLWKRLVPSQQYSAPPTMLDKLAMVARDDQEVWRPTVAGLLMASHEPHRFLPGAFIQAVVYQGTQVLPEAEKAYQRDTQDITGPLDRQVPGAGAFVRKRMQVAARKHARAGEKICLSSIFSLSSRRLPMPSPIETTQWTVQKYAFECLMTGWNCIPQVCRLTP